MSGRGRGRTTRARTITNRNAEGRQSTAVLDRPPHSINDEDGGDRGFLGYRRSSTSSTTTRATARSYVDSYPQVEEWETCMRMIERFQNLQAPMFHGGSDPLVADRWKEDMGNILKLMGMDPIQRQKLVAFSLKSNASKWYRS